MFPTIRLRRLRYIPNIRDVLQENHITVHDLILPLFVKAGNNINEVIKTMPNYYRYSVDNLIPVVRKAHSYGIKIIALFPVIDPHLKNNNGNEAYNPNNLICSAVQEIKSAVPDICIMTDVALDPYTKHGHDGILKNNEILNDETIVNLCKQALVQAAAGSDIIAPSDMMDGRVSSIRKSLDNSCFEKICIASYAVKYKSCLYSPFRDAVEVKNQQLDKSSYQVNIGNSSEAMREIELDIKEGADMVIIKPGLFYLDIIKSAADKFNIPIFAYQVSGEYSMLRTFQDENIILESLIAFKRAGARAIFTYFALEVAEKLCNG